MSNPQPDGSVKVDDVEVVGAVTECGKLADDEFSIPKNSLDLCGKQRVPPLLPLQRQEASHCACGWFSKGVMAGRVVKGDVETPNSLSVMGNRFEGIVPREDMVKVNVIVEEDIRPHGLGEAGTISSDNERMLRSPDINEEVCLEGESVGNTWIKGLRWDWDVGPQIHGFVRLNSSPILFADSESSIG